MNIRRSSLAVAAVVLVLLAGSTREAEAAILIDLSVDVSSPAPSAYLYSYTLTNLATSDHDIFAFMLDVDAGATLTSIAASPGWSTAYAPGDSVISWDSADATADLAPGASLVFSFIADLGPGSREFVVLGIDGNADLDFASGTSLAPLAAVPEPGGVMLLVSGVGLCCIALTRKAA